MRIQPIVVKNVDVGENVAIVSSGAAVEQSRVTCGLGTVPIFSAKSDDKNRTVCGE